MKRVPFADTSFAATFKDVDAARTYDARHAARARKLGKLLARSLAGLGFESGHILDAGSAAGHTAMALAEAFGSATLVGLDLCDPLLELGRAHAEARGLTRRLTFTKGDVQAMPFDDGSFDAVVSNDTLHVVPDPVAMITECERVLAPGGILLVRCIRRCWLGCLDGVFKTAYTPAEVRQLLQRSSLRPWKVRVGLISLLIEAGGRRAPS